MRHAADDLLQEPAQEASTMKKLMAILTASIALLAAGCATTYTSADEGIGGGYSEIRLAPDSYRVIIEGNGFTSRAEAEQFAMRRCAELTLEQGRRYFILESHKAWIERRRTSSGPVHYPMNEAVVTFVDGKSREAFDAVTVIEETNKIANGKLSSKAKHALVDLTSNS
jgi:hypothetical protein